MATSNVIEVMDEYVDPSDIISVKHATVRLDDANVVALNGLVTGERDLYNAVAPSAVTTDEVVIIAPADVYQLSNGMRIPITDPTQVDYPIGRPLRAYKLRENRRFKVSNTAISGTPVAGQYAIPANGSYGLAAASDLTGGTKIAFIVEETGSTCNIFVGSKVVPATIIRVVKGV